MFPRYSLALPNRLLHRTLGYPDANRYYNYILRTINPLLWLRNRETSGTNAANSGSGGSALDGTIAGTTTLGQTGKLGANEAFLFDGATSRVQIANHALLANLTTQRWAFLCNPSALGENSSGVMFCWGTGDAPTKHIFRLNSSNRMNFEIRASGSTASAITNNNQVSDCIGVWCWFFGDYDNAGTRKCRIWKGVSGTVTQLTLATDTAASGTLNAPTDALFLGNRQNLDMTFAGLRDEVIAGSGLWTLGEMQQIVSLTGV